MVRARASFVVELELSSTFTRSVERFSLRAWVSSNMIRCVRRCTSIFHKLDVLTLFWNLVHSSSQKLEPEGNAVVFAWSYSIKCLRYGCAVSIRAGGRSPDIVIDYDPTNFQLILRFLQTGMHHLFSVTQIFRIFPLIYYLTVQQLLREIMHGLFGCLKPRRRTGRQTSLLGG